MEIRDIFILKEGIPIYHKKQPESNLRKDETLTMGFLSALTSFAMEIGAGVPRLYATDTARFTFFERDDHLFIVYSDLDITNEQILDFSRKLSDAFFKSFNGRLTGTTLPVFDDYTSALLTEFYQTNKPPSRVKLEESRYMMEMKQLVPKIHVEEEQLRLTTQRRKLFKLIDGKNSVYEIANQLNENPQRVLSILRSYKKEGAVTF
ncbi:MAG: hypothetical protein ACTSRW_14455 [Candidatus Helarchaeota archaeon]